jgi:hypothetical protein
MNNYLTFLTSSGEEDTWFKIINDIFSLDLGVYDNLDISPAMLSNLRATIIGLFIGVVLASFLSIFNRRVHGEFVRSLIGENCGSREKAQTLSALGYIRNSAVRAAIRGGNTYRGVVRCVEAEDFFAAVEQKRRQYYENMAASGEAGEPFCAPKFVYDFDKMHFYIPEEQHFTAQTRFDKKGTGVIPAIIIMVLSVVLLWATLKILPEMLQLLDNFLGMMDTTPNIN